MLLVSLLEDICSLYMILKGFCLETAKALVCLTFKSAFGYLTLIIQNYEIKKGFSTGLLI